MDIQAEKLNLIKWLTSVDEPSVIKQLIALKKKQQVDWWDEISDEEKAAIEEGLAQADAGLGEPAEEVTKRLRIKYGLNG